MIKFIIILLVIVLIINLLYILHFQIKIVKKRNGPLYIKIFFLKKVLFFHEIPIKINRHSQPSFKFRLINLFDTNLKDVMNNLKDTNFIAYLILEYAKITKVTVIPIYTTFNPILLPYVGVADWVLVSMIKKYIDTTFDIVEDDYYQIMLLNEKETNINFEIYFEVSILNVIKAIIINYKNFIKLFKKKENKHGEQIK